MRLFFAAAILCTASLASAQAPAPAPAPPRTPTPRRCTPTTVPALAPQHKTCVIDFKGEDVTGGVDKPGGSVFSAREWIGASSLIHLRRDFITEIIKCAEDLE